MQIRYATRDDGDFFAIHRRHISESEMQEKIDRKQVIVLEMDGEIVGWIRFGLFWDNTPFLNMIHIFEQHRRRGYGSQLMTFWENEMKQQGYELVMTSTQSDEQAQFFYRHLGYEDAGAVLFPGQAAELFLIKKLEGI